VFGVADFSRGTGSIDTRLASTIAPWQRAVEKIRNIMGPTQGTELIAETLRSLNLTQVSTVDDLLRFGHALLPHGGMIEALGRSIKVHAVLCGAKDTTSG